MTPDRHPVSDARQVKTLEIGRSARVIVLRGAIRGPAADDLRVELLAAIEAGAREVFLDLSDVESLSSSVHDLVAAAGLTLADRGGVLLAWSRKYSVGEPTYVITELRDRALAELMPTPAASHERSRP
jgi:anti-anti-sigma regulatory factor